MKKTTIAVLGIAFAVAIAIPAFALGLGNAPVQAQANPLSQRVCAALSCVNAAGDCSGNAGCYVDDNGDGICDNYANRADGSNAGNGNGYGAGNGPRYVDDNGDGVCDNYVGGAGNGCGNGAGTGNDSAGYGHRGGGHRGAHC